MKRIFTYLLSFSMSILVALPILPATPIYAAANEEGPITGGTSLDAYLYNGTLSVYYLNQGDWLLEGSIAYDEFVKEQALSITGLDTSQSVSIKLVQNGGGNAQLDVVTLDGQAPVQVAGAGGKSLAKVSKQDLDLINLEAEGTVITFNGGAKEATLTVAARIEDMEISKIPFRFPLMSSTANDAFYNYTLDSQRGMITLDGKLDEVAAMPPFSKEWAEPATGHPNNYLYTWVFNDDNYLYVTMDGAPDNTMDDWKDYAKVYVNTASGLQDYKLSIYETTWGKSSFSYTDHAVYEHKVYEFKIPLTEFAPSSAPLRIAFEFYGTSAPGASDDSYATPMDTVLTVPAPGVLSNDGTYGGTRTAVLGGLTPLHGNVVLQTDGSFTYTPNAGYVGADAFKYQFTDSYGYGTSNQATVLLSVTGGSISPTTANFDKLITAQADVSTTMVLNDNTLNSVTNGGDTLDPGLDYTVSDNIVTINKSYLATLLIGVTSLTFNFSGGGTQTLAITISDTTPIVYGTPVLQTPAAGNAQVSLAWNSVDASTGYKIHKSETAGNYGSEVITLSSSDSSYIATGLTNGTTYYFMMKAVNPEGDSVASNEVSAMPKTVPGAPTDLVATAGNGQANLSFTVPSTDGGSPITSYTVTSSPDNITATGSTNTFTIPGLTNGTTYTFIVTALNSAGESIASAASNAVTPQSPSSGSSSSVIPPVPVTTNNGVNVLVNGKVENAGTAATTQVNNQTVITISVDSKKLEDKLATEGQESVITIPFLTQSDVVIGEINGQTLKNMEQKQAILELKTENATYRLPAQQINIDAISAQLSKTVALQDIKVQIEIATPSVDTLKIVADSAIKEGLTLMAPPLNFTVRGIYGNTTTEVTKFNAYVERTIALPDGVDPNKITTGVVIEPDGSVRHVPTKVVIIDGKYYAQVNSLTNSTYSIVWHPLEFNDVSQHWAKAAINNMGARMVMSGSDNNRFDPEQDISRAEFVSIIVRGLGLKLENGASPYTDVLASAEYSSAIETAYTYGLISGYSDHSFRPLEKMTREQAMMILSKAMTITDLKGNSPIKATGELWSPFTDANLSADWAKNSITDCLQAGIISGRNGTLLAPKANISRAEVAAMVQRLLQKSGLI
ncbi:S-layer homology domain-containing protein [Paenibacillus monticola]|nr:S-layer homology domain-containing protein [Paenibacillus monticola]